MTERMKFKYSIASQNLTRRGGGYVFARVSKYLANRILDSWYHKGPVNLRDIYIMRFEERRRHAPGYVTAMEWIRLMNQGLFDKLHWRAIDHDDIEKYIKITHDANFYKDYFGLNLNEVTKEKQ